MQVSYEIDPRPYDFEGTWDKIGLGRSVPEGMDIVVAWACAHQLWLKAIQGCVQGHPLIIRAAFTQSLLGPIELSGRLMDFDDFKQFGLDGGVDYMLDSWLSGVPLEFILCE